MRKSLFMPYLGDFRAEFATPNFSFTREVFNDDETRLRVHKHLSDRDDLITDDDLKNIKTEMVAVAELNDPTRFFTD